MSAYTRLMLAFDVKCRAMYYLQASLELEWGRGTEGTKQWPTSSLDQRASIFPFCIIFFPMKGSIYITLGGHNPCPASSLEPDERPHPHLSKLKAYRWAFADLRLPL